MKLIFFEEELLMPVSDPENKMYTKAMVEDLSGRKVGVILGNNGYKTMMESMKFAIENDYYAIITNQIYLLNLECFIDEDGTRDIYMASMKKKLPIDYIEDYLGRQIEKTDNLEQIYRDIIDK